MYLIYVRNSSRDRWLLLEGSPLATFEKALELALTQSSYWTYITISHRSQEVWNK